MSRWRLADEELRYLRDQVGLPGSDVAALAGLRFSGDVWAVPEGRVVFAGEPLLEITAPLPQAQIVETVLLKQITFQTAVASKAARCRIAAGGTELVDFAARRAHGLEAALAVARLTAMVGFTGTSYVEAAHRFGLRPVGTMAHSYVQVFGLSPGDFSKATVFLVDTYDTTTGVDHAIAVAAGCGVDDRRCSAQDLPLFGRALLRGETCTGSPPTGYTTGLSIPQVSCRCRRPDGRPPVDLYGTVLVLEGLGQVFAPGTAPASCATGRSALMPTVK